MARPGLGLVYLIGAGPGDPGLITLKGDRALALADVVIYDHLVHPRVLDRARPEARRIFVGKRPGYAHRPGGRYGMSQAAINRLMVREARRGKVIARVKGGDPFVFGRGGEEALALAGARVRFEVIPGVTAAIAAPACAGIPVTHRGLSSAFLLVTGHEDPAKRESGLRWDWLARFDGTLAIYMGAKRLPAIARALIENGKSPRTPAAVIERGTWTRQRTVTGTLATIAGRCRAARVAPPAMVILGATVGLRGAIAWFEKRPLAGRRVVVTRARDQAGALAACLETAGAEVIDFPAIALMPPRSWAPADRAIRALSGSGWERGRRRRRPPAPARYSWIVFLSANAVERFFDRVQARGEDARALAGCLLAAIGPSTARALAGRGLRPDVVAEESTSEGLARALRWAIGRGDRVLLPRTDIGREMLPETLRRRGARVDEVAVYRTAPARGPDVAAFRRSLARGEADVLTFASAQTARNFAAALGRGAVRRLPSRVRVATIGPATSAACRELGLRVHAEARAPSPEGLVEAVRQALRRGAERVKAGG